MPIENQRPIGSQGAIRRANISPVIAIDGTFASGKGTLGKALASHYKLPYLDTGKLYRAVALAILDCGGDIDDPDICAAAAHALNINTLDRRELKSGPVGAAASKVAIHVPVRNALFTFQRNFAQNGAVLDGRDIGTVICPDADAKLYIDASAQERARRRHEELKGYGEDISFDAVLAQLKERDGRDMNRTEAPLMPAEDAHLLDTTNLSIERAFDVSVNLIDTVLAMRP